MVKSKNYQYKPKGANLSLKKDKKLKAKSPGKRISKNGNIYYEYRTNRTDVKGRDTPKKIKSKQEKINRIKNFINNIVKEKATRTQLINKFATIQNNNSFQTIKNDILELIKKNKIKVDLKSDDINIKRQKEWEKKQKHKIERLKKSIQKYKYISKSSYNEVSKLAGMIPFGQPILIGHHSQRAHENLIKKIDNKMRKSVEASHTLKKLERIEMNKKDDSTIYSDDPKALVKLEKKKNDLEKLRTEIKEHNKKARKNKMLKRAPDHELINLGQNIRSIEKRIKQIKKTSEIKDFKKTKKGLTIKTDSIIQRVQLIFDEIPNLETRNTLKSSGFRWSPKNESWQKKLLTYNIRNALNFYNDFPNLTQRRY